jgi:hypothetical protein
MVMFDPITLLAALGPLVVDAGKAAIQKWMAPDEFKPTKIEDYLSMRQNDLEMFKAMNEAGGSNPTYLWVEAIVRLMRPAVAIVVIGTWALLKMQGVPTEGVDSFAAAIGFYLFGDRTLFYSRKAVMK